MTPDGVSGLLGPVIEPDPTLPDATPADRGKPCAFIAEDWPGRLQGVMQPALQDGVDGRGQGADLIDGGTVLGHGRDTRRGECRVQGQSPLVLRVEGVAEPVRGIGRGQEDVGVVAGWTAPGQQFSTGSAASCVPKAQEPRVSLLQ